MIQSVRDGEDTGLYSGYCNHYTDYSMIQPVRDERIQDCIVDTVITILITA